MPYYLSHVVHLHYIFMLISMTFIFCIAELTRFNFVFTLCVIFTSTFNIVDVMYCSSIKSCCWKCRRKKEYRSRMVCIGRSNHLENLPPNVIRNQKYNIFSFIPLVSYPPVLFYMYLSLLIHSIYISHLLFFVSH